MDNKLIIVYKDKISSQLAGCEPTTLCIKLNKLTTRTISALTGTHIRRELILESSVLLKDKSVMTKNRTGF